MVSDQKREKFINVLKFLGNSAGNKSLRKALKWSEATYDKVKEDLINSGTIEKGRGGGGRVMLSENVSHEPAPDLPIKHRERSSRSPATILGHDLEKRSTRKSVSRNDGDAKHHDKLADLNRQLASKDVRIKELEEKLESRESLFKVKTHEWQVRINQEMADWKKRVEQNLALRYKTLKDSFDLQQVELQSLKSAKSQNDAKFAVNFNEQNEKLKQSVERYKSENTALRSENEALKSDLENLQKRNNL